MGTTKLKEQILRDEVKLREAKYKEDIRKEMLSKFKYVCLNVIPALISGIFDPTVRGMYLNIVKPDNYSIHTTTEDIEVMGELFDYKPKAIYFEELFKWN